MHVHNSIQRWALMLMICSSGAVIAQQTEYTSSFGRENALELYADAIYGYDDNLFRTPTVLIHGVPTSDTSFRRDAGITLDKSFSRQHFTGNLDVNKTTFDRFNQIDYQGTDAAINWNWGITNDLTGDIGDTYSRSLTPYTQFHGAVLNLQTVRNQLLDQNWLITPSWQLHSSFSKNTTAYDLPSQQYGDNTVYTANAGLDFVSAAGNKTGLLVQKMRGEYPVEQPLGQFLVNNGYTQDELKFNIDYSYSGLTHLHFLGGWARREYQNFTERNISGPSATLDLSFYPTGKTVIAMQVWRTISSTGDITLAYAVSKGASISPVWNVTDKLLFNVKLQQNTLDYSSASAFAQQLPQDRIDVLRNESVSAVYSPFRKIQLRASLYDDQLKSSISTYTYRDKGLTLSAHGAF